MSLDKLKAELLEASVFIDVFNHFFDLLDESPELMNAGEPTREPLLESAVLAAAGEMGGPEDRVENLLLIGLSKVGFVHGRFTMGGRLGAFFYFADVQTGLVSVVDAASGHTQVARFSASRPTSGLSSN